MTIRVLVADDHTLFRDGLIGLMETRDELVQVVGEAATGREAVQLAERLQPDLILMDIYMPDLDGLEATRQILARFPHIKIVMLTSSERDEHLYQAVALGAAGYLLKDVDTSRLFELLAGVMRGQTAMTPEVASRLVRGVAKRSASPEPAAPALTERELAVLRLVAVGASNQEIAEKLCVSVYTVKKPPAEHPGQAPVGESHPGGQLCQQASPAVIPPEHSGDERHHNGWNRQRPQNRSGGGLRVSFQGDKILSTLENCRESMTRTLNQHLITRRSFLRWSAALGGTAVLAGGVPLGLKQVHAALTAAEGQWIPAACWHDCGGRCLIKAFVANGGGPANQDGWTPIRTARSIRNSAVVCAVARSGSRYSARTGSSIR